MNLKKLISLLMAASVLLVGAVLPARAGILSQWTFEASLPTTAGPISPEVGSGIGSARHADLATDYSHPAGSGSDASWSANRWTTGDYFQFRLDTLGYQNVVVSWDQTSRLQGPSSFEFSYSLDGDNFNFFDNNDVSDSWASYSVDLSSVSMLNNASAVYFRVSAAAMVNFGGRDPNDTFPPDGTSQIDNFTVSATAVSTAVPDSLPGPVSVATLLVLVALSRCFSTRRCLS